MAMATSITPYLFTVPLALQAFWRHPYYTNSKAASAARVLLMPATIYLALTSNLDRHFEPRDKNFHVNFTISSFLTVHIVCLAIQLGLSQDPPLPVSNKLKAEEKMGKDNPQKLSSRIDVQSAPSWGDLIKFTVWLLTSPRFVGTTWAPPKSVLPPAPKLSMWDFFIKTMKNTLKHHFMFVSWWFVGVMITQHPQGCYGFLTQECGLPEGRLLKILAPYLNGIPFAFATWLTVENLCNLATLADLAVYCFGPRILPKTLAPGPFDSTLYSPIYPNLWGQSSIAEFWSKGWHAALRRDIVFCVGNTSAMLFSAFFHEYGKYCSYLVITYGYICKWIAHTLLFSVVISSAPAPDPTWGTAKCWIYSAAAVGFEYLFTVVTGKRVGGGLGKVWTYSVLFTLQLHTISKWLEFGLGQAGIVPVSLWTWHRYVIPFGPSLPESWIFQTQS
ncbi:uncharacterized protein MELLADRAFT_109156 [Melampsora larici-populina 98AG31]|uniref:Wax synthase domain-containing protein n=1 Tax=Melampsora larici-populina (strain 98AG31 / pathotype 3-4-7) TaxID=747676 RepID=F4RVH7_MELLP|nr:uncharacterized protein MELLADRAFT_109156 [Melampsora larici-populina 98AG31]EGG03669.1 hypothetical protein MELLADRAFT_109156 [Melampsora larici-populina 98AG31]